MSVASFSSFIFFLAWRSFIIRSNNSRDEYTNVMAYKKNLNLNLNPSTAAYNGFLSFKAVKPKPSVRFLGLDDDSKVALVLRVMSNVCHLVNWDAGDRLLIVINSYE